MIAPRLLLGVFFGVSMLLAERYFHGDRPAYGEGVSAGVFVGGFGAALSLSEYGLALVWGAAFATVALAHGVRWWRAA